VDGVQNLKVITTLINTGTDQLKLLNDPRTVLDKSPTHTFTITNADGTSPTFKGIMVKYVPEKVIQDNQDSFFTVLEPGQKMDVTHDLSSVYDFSSSGAGDYNFVPFNRFQHVSPSGKLMEILADHQPANLKINGLLSKPVDTTTGSLQKRAKFNGCSDNEQTGIKKAIEMAQSSALDTSGYSNLLSLVSTERYKTWFGEYDHARVNLVQKHFNRISREGLKDFSFDCTCERNDVFAYVYPDQFGKIYLCGAFWRATNSGTDSRAGTLIHESSHFTDIAGTEDYVYGQAGAKDLAQTNPDEAVANADSYEYFAENSPFLV